MLNAIAAMTLYIVLTLFVVVFEKDLKHMTSDVVIEPEMVFETDEHGCVYDTTYIYTRRPK